MNRYAVRLINPDANLDLATRENDIHLAFQYIRNGGCTGRRFKDFSQYKIIDIQSHCLLVDVDESSKAWHRFVGNFLANKRGMRHFCDPKNSRRMLKWTSPNGTPCGRLYGAMV